jgi:hypothetical protein
MDFVPFKIVKILVLLYNGYSSLWELYPFFWMVVMDDSQEIMRVLRDGGTVLKIPHESFALYSPQRSYLAKLTKETAYAMLEEGYLIIDIERTDAQPREGLRGIFYRASAGWIYYEHNGRTVRESAETTLSPHRSARHSTARSSRDSV